MSSVLRVRDLMSPDVATLRENDKLSIADDVMRLGRIRHMPVVSDDDELVGIVSQRDLFRGALARALGYGEHAQSKMFGMLHVKDVMSRQVSTVSPDAEIREAARLMLDRKIGCLVVTEGERVAGILTEADFVRAMVESG